MFCCKNVFCLKSSSLLSTKLLPFPPLDQTLHFLVQKIDFLNNRRGGRKYCYNKLRLKTLQKSVYSVLSGVAKTKT